MKNIRPIYSKSIKAAEQPLKTNTRVVPAIRRRAEPFSAKIPSIDKKIQGINTGSIKRKSLLHEYGYFSRSAATATTNITTWVKQSIVFAFHLIRQSPTRANPTRPNSEMLIMDASQFPAVVFSNWNSPKRDVFAR